jgi:hypothetical protein
MGIFKRRVPRHYIPIHPDNVTTKDWIVLLEAGTMVGRSAENPRGHGHVGKENRHEVQHFLAQRTFPGFGRL